MAIRTPVDPDHKMARAGATNAKNLRELAASIKSTVKPIVDSAVARLEALLANYLTRSDADNLYAAKTHTHDGSQIVSGTVTRPTNNTSSQSSAFLGGSFTGTSGTFSGAVSGSNGVFSTGLASAGARNNQVTNGYVAAYLDANGNLGFAPSTKASKDVGSPYAVDMSKFLALTLFNWQYKNGGMKGIGPLADDMDAAGLTEFVTYDPVTGKPQGLRYESLTIGLWSAYVQSRTSTLARIANQKHMTVTVPIATALSLGQSRSYALTWPTPFVDADYHVTASVYTSAGVLVAGASAAVAPSAKTATGCTVQVSTGVALLATMSIVVEATHI